MHTPRFSTKRALGLVMATALAVSGVVAVAGNSQATTVTNPVATLSPATGPVGGGLTVTVKGKGFMDTTGASVVLAAKFTTIACTSAANIGASATNIVVPLTSLNVVSATKAVLTTPAAMTAGLWYLCLWDAATASADVLGQGTFTTAAGPTATTLLPTAGSNVSNASVLGGTSLALTGTNFDKTTKATIDNLAAKTTYVSATKLSVVLPAHSVTTGLKINLTSTYGNASSTDTVSYVPVVGSVTPAFGDGTAGNVVTLTGVGFNSYTTGTAAGQMQVAFFPGDAAVVQGTTATPATVCTNVRVENDKTLNCQAPVLTGAYSVVIVVNDTTTPADVGAGSTIISRSATYTAAAF